MEKETASLGSADAFFRAYKERKGLNRAFVSVLGRDQGIQKNMKILNLLEEERANLARAPRTEQIQRMAKQVDALRETLARETGQTIKNIHKRKNMNKTRRKKKGNKKKKRRTNKKN